MNGKQRLKDAMDMRPVFPVPFMCQMSIGHMLVQLDVSPLEFWFDKNVFMNGIVKLRELYGFDGILVSLHGHNPNWRENIKNIVKTEEFVIGVLKNGDKIFCPYNELPYYEFEKPYHKTPQYPIQRRRPKAVDSANYCLPEKTGHSHTQSHYSKSNTTSQAWF